MNELFATGIGMALGWAMQRGQFCLNSGFAGLARGQAFEKARSLGLALSLAAAVIGVIRLVRAVMIVPGLLTTPPASSIPTLASLVYGIVGGLIFGASMPAAGGCASGIWMRLGEGRLSALGAIVGFGLALYIASYVLPGPPTGQYFEPSVLLLSLWTIGAFMVFGLLWHHSGTAASGASWTDRCTGVALGLLASGTWLAGQFVALPDLAIVPGMIAAGGWISNSNETLSPELFLVPGIALGAMLSARTRKTFFTRIPTGGAVLRAFAGGLGLGSGAYIAGGCTLGYGLDLAPLGSVDAFVVLLAIFLGRAIPARLTPDAAQRAPVRSAQPIAR